MKCNDTYYNRRTRIRKLFIFERLREGCSLFFGHTRYAEAQADNRPENTGIIKMVGPNGLEPSTSSVSRKRSNQTELQAYMDGCASNSNGGARFRQRARCPR